MKWWRRLLRGKALESQLDAELRDHLDRLTSDLVATGLTEAEARRRARLEFGGVESVKEDCRDARGTRWVEETVADVRYALRLLRKSRAFSAVAVLSLALGIGANLAVISLVDAVLLKTLPVGSPNDLVLFGERSPERQVLSWSRAHFRDLGRSPVLAGLCAFRPRMEFSLSGPAAAELVPGQFVSGNCFGVVGIRTAIGRTLTQDDDDAVRPVAVIGYGFWQRYFGGDAAAIGRTIQLKGRPFTVVGVTARDFVSFEAGWSVDITVPLSQAALLADARLTSSPSVRWLRLIGRLRHDVPRERAAEDLERLWRQLPDRRNPQGRFEMLPGAQGLNDLRQQFSVPLRILMAAVGLLLLVACANLASLMLARARAREHEIRLRLALGARRSRIIRQLLTEACVLSALGSVAGFGLAVWGSQAMVALLSRGRSAIDLPPTVDLRLLGFTFGLTATTSLAFGIWPALWSTRQAARADALPTRTSTGGGRRRASALVAAQATVSTLLLVGAILFGRSLSNLRSIDLGFDKHHLLIAGIRPKLGAGDRLGPALYRDLYARLSASPGAQAVSMAMDLPLGGVSYTAGVSVPSEGTADDQANYNFVGPRFFETMRIPLLAGRDFQLADDEQSHHVGVVSESLASRLFPGRNAVGQRVQAGNTLVEIVGIARDVPYVSLRTARERFLYRPFLQAPGAGGEVFVVRTDLPLGPAAELIRGALHEIAPAVPLASLTTLEDRVDGAIASERLLASISAFFGAMALLLVGIGVYGTLAYSIAQRARELGVRLALGATRGDIAGLVLRGALMPVCLGLAVGLPLTLAASRVAGGMLFGLTPREPAAYVTGIAVLLGAALVAAAVPIHRAAGTDPIAALREE